MGLENDWGWRIIGAGERLGLKNDWGWRIIGAGERLGLDKDWGWRMIGMPLLPVTFGRHTPRGMFVEAVVLWGHIPLRWN